jgi:hypothetical protein
MNSELLGRAVVLSIAVGVIVLGQTVAKGAAELLNGLAGTLIGWVIPWFAKKETP